MPAVPSTQRPGGRSERTRAAVHAAIESLVRDGGLGAVSVPAVADRAGVHASTIYRRWGGVQEILFDVILEGATRSASVADTGSLRGDLLHYAQGAARVVESPIGTALIQALVSLPLEDDGASRRRYWRRRRQTLDPIFQRARSRGETVPDPEDIIELMLAPLYFRRFVSARPIDREFVDGLVEAALRST